MRIDTVPGWHDQLRDDIDRRVEDNIVVEIWDEAIRTAPIATGRMAYTIYWVRTGPDSWEIRSPAPYTLYVEYDTKAHRIRAKAGGVLTWWDGGGRYFRREVWHPGTTEQPFMRPSLFKERPL